MTEWNLKDMLKDVPQPYKTWVVRACIPPIFVIGIPLAAAYDSVQWGKEMIEEVVDAWCYVRTW